MRRRLDELARPTYRRRRRDEETTSQVFSRTGTDLPSGSTADIGRTYSSRITSRASLDVGCVLHPEIQPVHDAEDTFTDIWKEAIERFKSLAGVDLADKNAELYLRFYGCSHYHEIVAALNQTLEKFKLYRDPSPHSPGARLRRILKSTVQAVLRAGVLDASGEAAAATAVPGGKIIFVALGTLLQATQGVSDRFDAVTALLQKFESYLIRLDVRLQAPFVPASREHIVKILVEMLNAFGIAIQMMRQHRVKHFLSVLVGGGQDVSNALKTLEDLQEDDTRLSLAEVHVGLRNLSTSLHLEASQVKDDVIQHIDEATSDMVRQVTVSLQASGVFELSRQLETLKATLEESKRCQIGSLERHGNSAQIMFAEMSTTLARNSRAVKELMDKMLIYFRGMTSEEQAALREAMAIIYTLSAFTIGGSSETAWCTVLLNPGAFVSTFLPMAAAYLLLYICWRQIRSIRSLGISRALDDPHFESVVIIDVLGRHLVLSLDRCSSWTDIHSLLLERFANKHGANYVESRAYVLMDTAGQSEIIKPSSWAQTVRGGMTLEMGIVVRQASHVPRCPWCELVAPADSYNDFTRCQGCKRYYRASNATLTSAEDDAVKRLSKLPADVPTPLAPTLRSANEDVGDETVSDSVGVRQKESMALYRRIVVELLSAYSDESQRSAQQPSSSIQYHKILLTLVNNIGQPLQHRIVSQMLERLPTVPWEELLEWSRHCHSLGHDLRNGASPYWELDYVDSESVRRLKLSFLVDLGEKLDKEITVRRARANPPSTVDERTPVQASKRNILQAETTTPIIHSVI